jgi:Antitoxin ParD
MGRLTIDITDHQHQSIKAMAALEGKTIKEYAVERLFAARGDEELALIELKGLLGKRMAEYARGDVVSQSITEIAEAQLKNSV